MKFTLNPYAFVIEIDGITNFVLSDYNKSAQIVLNEKQSEILYKMHKQEFYDYEVLCENFDIVFVNALIENGCFIPTILDTVTSYSRSNAFFTINNMPEARKKLNESKVLILGCGGIGTHMAWHMAALGIEKLTIVDFDTVEESNLNRQLLFDCCDFGKSKVKVVKDKLSSINPSVHTETVRTRISSQDELEKICLSDNYNLVIKALDSPPEFPLWLDNVARKNNITYISGITMNENVLIGPSYIPDDSTSCGWSELMNLDFKSSKRVYGTAPSVGIMLYHISDELAIEAFKILTGYGSIKYKGKILCENIFTNQKHIIEKNTHGNKEAETHSAQKTTLLNMFLMIALSLASISQQWFLLVGFIVAMTLPFVLYKMKQNIIKSTFLNSIIMSFGVIAMIIRLINISSIFALISAFVLMFEVHSAIILLMCLLNFFICKLIHKQ